MNSTAGLGSASLSRASVDARFFRQASEGDPRAMALDRDTVRKIARLARIKVKDDELDHLAGELGQILSFVEQLDEVDTKSVEPMTSVVEVSSAHARGRGQRRRRRRESPAQRAGRRPWFLRRAQGGRVSASPTAMTLAEARDALAKGALSSQELTEAHIKAVEAARPLNAMITETPERAMDMAAASDERRGKGEVGLLEGLPIAIKDLFCTEGVLTTAASHILHGFTPPYESTVTANLWRAGAVMLGKTNLDEFAMGSSNMTSHYGAVENPWRRQGDNRPLVPGGSSGGSAAAVAARAALAATGTDTGGSIRQPASFTGIVGLKPTYGRCSRWGIVAFASSLDQAGPMTRTVRDAALMLRAMAGHDPEGLDLGAAAGAGLRGGADRRRARPQDRHPEGIPRRRHAGRDRDACGGRASIG